MWRQCRVAGVHEPALLEQEGKRHAAVHAAPAHMLGVQGLYFGLERASAADADGNGAYSRYISRRPCLLMSASAAATERDIADSRANPRQGSPTVAKGLLRSLEEEEFTKKFVTLWWAGRVEQDNDLVSVCNSRGLGPY